jgi:hypothetical protein
MARTHKAERLYQAKRATIRYQIHVLEAAEEFVSRRFNCETHSEKAYLLLEICTRHEVKVEDVSLVLIRF